MMKKKDNSKDKPFFYKRGVKPCKKPILKIRFQTLIEAIGMTEPNFYNKIGISRQLWYFVSWGIWEPANYLKVRIAKELNTDSSVIFGDIDYSNALHKLKLEEKKHGNNIK